MLCFETPDHKFQVRAAGLIVDAGHLLLHQTEGDDFWVPPGGRVEQGEAAADAVQREFHEELGVALEQVSMAFIVENFFAHDGRHHHELGFYFYARLPVNSPLRNKAVAHSGLEAHARLEFRWFPLAELGAVNVYPEFLRHEPLVPGTGLRHLIDGEAPARYVPPGV